MTVLHEVEFSVGDTARLELLEEDWGVKGIAHAVMHPRHDARGNALSNVLNTKQGTLHT